MVETYPASGPVQPAVQLLTKDVHTAVLDYCGDGIVAFERTLLLQAPDADADLVHEIQQGLQSLYDGAALRIGAAVELFEQVSGASVFKPPLRDPTPAPMAPPLSVPFLGCEEAEQTKAGLQRSVLELRNQLMQVDRQCMAAHSKVAQLDSELAAGDTSIFRLLASTTVGANDSLCAVLDMAKQLQPLLDKAQLFQAATTHNGTAQVGDCHTTMKMSSADGIRAFGQALLLG